MTKTSTKRNAMGDSLYNKFKENVINCYSPIELELFCHLNHCLIPILKSIKNRINKMKYGNPKIAEEKEQFSFMLSNLIHFNIDNLKSVMEEQRYVEVKKIDDYIFKNTLFTVEISIKDGRINKVRINHTEGSYKKCTL